jgi:hypothetical protein
VPLSLVEEARSFLDELFTTGIPLQPLLRSGIFPDGWPARYLAFLERVSEETGDVEPLPREVIAVIYDASVYCTKRFHDWQSAGGTNQVTEHMVDQIRWAGDAIVLGRYWRKTNQADDADRAANSDSA